MKFSREKLYKRKKGKFLTLVRLTVTCMTQHIFHCCRGEHTRPALIIRCHIELSTKTARRSLKGPGNGKLKQMVRKFPTFRSERKKRTTSGGSPQFPNGFFGKLPFHFTLNRNFRIFLAKWIAPLVLGQPF